jgi:type VI secretion system protein VasG
MIDFKNTIILLTSNAGSELVMNMCKDPELLPDPESLATAMAGPLQKIFPPALLGRLVVIPYYPLSEEMLGQIVRLQLNRIKKRVAENHRIPFEYSDQVVELVVKRCNNAESGGRIIDSILTNTVLPKISIEYLTRMSEGAELKAVNLGAAEDDFTYAFQ